LPPTALTGSAFFPATPMTRPKKMDNAAIWIMLSLAADCDLCNSMRPLSKLQSEATE
jgi:hypothetical protein